MIVGIYINKNKPAAGKVLNKIKSGLNAAKTDYVVFDKIDDIKKVSVLLVLGGDGTILSASKKAIENNMPIIGINLGEIGFLTEFEPHEAEQIADFIKNGEFIKDERILIKTVYLGKSYIALNEAAINRIHAGEGYAQLVFIEAKIDGNIVDNPSSDGVIISTPTGSTAYSLSAGGSILDKNLDAFIMTAICPHSLHSRPIVFSASSTVQLTVKKENCPCALFIDGIMAGEIKTGEKITVTKSSKSLTFLRRKNTDFFKKISLKLNKL